jgi:tetratricopeptide (TPR) repeat protein
MRLHRLDHAEANLQRAVEADSGDVDAWYLLGLAQYQRERHRDAIATLSGVVERWPWHAQAHATLGNAQLRAGEVAAGRASLRTFEDLHQASERARTLERAAQADPTNADVWLRLAQQFVTRQEWSRAAAALRIYARLRPADEQGRELLGYVYLQADDYESALDVYGALVERYPNAAEHHNSVGVVYMLLGEHQAAIDHLLQAIRLDASGRQYLLNLERAYLRAGNPNAADEISGRYRAMRPAVETAR